MPRGALTGKDPGTSVGGAAWGALGSAVYRDGGGSDWRRDLADQSELAEGESRRFGTSDYVPFRSGGSAAVSGQSNLSTTSTSLITAERLSISTTSTRSENGCSTAAVPATTIS